MLGLPVFPELLEPPFGELLDPEPLDPLFEVPALDALLEPLFDEGLDPELDMPPLDELPPCAPLDCEPAPPDGGQYAIVKISS
jgi:hypothetical protein